jgi:hypothetical protein
MEVLTKPSFIARNWRASSPSSLTSVFTSVPQGQGSDGPAQALNERADPNHPWTCITGMNADFRDEQGFRSQRDLTKAVPAVEINGF